MSEVHYPLLFNFRETVSGNDFLAGVTVTGGRALMLQEDGEWWMYGVRPSGLAENGETSQETFLRFIQRLRTVLFDIALDATTYEDFEARARIFLYDADKSEESRWNAAQQSLRAGNISADEDQSFLAKLPKELPEERPTSIGIFRVDDSKTGPRFSPTDNVTPAPRLAA